MSSSPRQLGFVRSNKCFAFSISLLLNQPFEVAQVFIDSIRYTAAEVRGQLQAHARAVIRKRREGNDSSGKVIVRMTVGNSSPGQPSLRDAQCDLKRRLIFLSV